MGQTASQRERRIASKHYKNSFFFSHGRRDRDYKIFPGELLPNFRDHIGQLGGSIWKCIPLEGLSFGGSHYCTYVWVRVTPMTSPGIIDRRMKILLAGVMLYAWKNITLCLGAVGTVATEPQKRGFWFLLLWSDFC